MIDELLFYLPGTADNLLFLTLAVLILLMLTGVYGYLNLTTHQAPETAHRWSWPLLSIGALLILLYWFGAPFSFKTDGNAASLLTLFSPIPVGTLVIASGAAAVLASRMRWALAAASVSLLSSGLLFLQAHMPPLMILSWLTLGGLIVLLCYHNCTDEESPESVSAEQDEEGAFREPLLACLACGFLLCVCLWVVQRDWGPGAEVTPVPKSEWAGLSLPELLPRLFSQHWPTLLLLLCFVLLVFVGMTWLVFSPRASRISQTEEPGGNA